MALQIPKVKASDNLKMISFVCWAAYGVIPTLHWVNVMGGWENPIVAVSHHNGQCDNNQKIFLKK